MKKSLTKLIVSCTAVAAVAAAMAVTASAANVTVAEDKASITNNNAVPVAEGKQATILVQKKTDSALTEGDIFYIDQAEAKAANWTTIKFAEALEDGDYVLKMGGEGVANITTEEFTVGEDTPVTKVKKGDVNADETVDGDDALMIVQYSVKKKFADKVTKPVADVNVDDAIDGDDALMIVQFAVKKKFADKVGIEVEVPAEA